MIPTVYAPIPGVRVIGLGHKARQGKDTAAAFLVQEYGATRYGFADDLYAVCRILHGMTVKDAPLLQRVGVERRRFDPDVWVRSVYTRLWQDRPAVAVMSDVRFPNELAMIRAIGGECWKIERRTRDGSVYVDPSRPADHISETANDAGPWDCVIANHDGQQDDFLRRVGSAYLHFLQIAA